MSSGFSIAEIALHLNEGFSAIRYEKMGVEGGLGNENSFPKTLGSRNRRSEANGAGIRSAGKRRD